MSSLCEDIKLHTSKLLVCNDTNLGTEISTPISYPDGEAITVFVFVNGNSVTLHDGGMAAYSLGKIGQPFTKKIAQRADYFAKLYGCEVRNQRVHRSCDLNQMTAAIYTVATVCSFIGSHLAFDEKDDKNGYPA